MGTDLKGYEVAYRGRVYVALEMKMFWKDRGGTGRG